MVKPINAVTNPLIDSLVGNLVGDGVKVLNIKSNLKPTTKALGTFKGPKQLLGIKEGLMMVTGDVSAMVGANTGALIESNQILPADTLPGCSSGRQFLNKVLNYDVPVGTSRRATDCATIQFDIIPSADSIKFNYVFASEEYNTFVCSNFNDIFGFFINGPGIVGDQSLAPTFTMTKNLAIIPNSDLPVSINTVNNGEPGSAGVASNCTFTSEGTDVYLDNTDISFNPFIFNRLKFNGLTTVLTAAVKVVPCQTYTLTLTVSDVNDGSYDSGVFIEKGSLRSGLTTSASSVYSARFPYSIINCNPGTFIVKRDGSNAGERVLARYTIGGTAINGVDYVQRLRNGNTQPLIDSIVLEPGVAADTITIVGLDGPTWSTTEQKYIVLKFLNSILPYFNGAPNYCGDSSFMYIRKKFLYNAGPDKKICQLQDTLLKPVSIQVSSDIYRWRELNVNGDTIVSQYLSCDTCPIPRAFNPTTTSFVVYVFDSLSRCVTSDTVKVDILNLPTFNFSTTTGEFGVCKGDEIEILANPLSSNPAWKYKWYDILPINSLGLDSDESKSRRVLTVFAHNKTQYYKVTAKNELNCESTDSVQISVITLPSFKIPETDTVCFGTPIRLVPLELNDTLTQTTYSWKYSDDKSIKDSTRSSVSFIAKKSGSYILSASNKCFSGGGIAQDTFNLAVADSISTAFTYAIQNDGLTNVPIQFTGGFFPTSYQRSFKLYNDSKNWDTTLLGLNPFVNLKKGGEHRAEVVIFRKLGQKLCKDSTNQFFTISDLGNVFIPNLVTDNGDGSNSAFRITARDENGNVLRDIKSGKLVLFNRWGKKIYENDNYNNDLDSSKIKEEVNDGIYFFEFSVERYNYKNGGWLRIQR